MIRDLEGSALLIVDLQVGLDDPSLPRRDNRDCESNIARLLAAWFAAGRPVVYVRHDSAHDDSPLRPGQPGNALKTTLDREPDLLVVKSTASAFLGRPDLDAWLRERGISTVVIAGVQTDQCCAAAARSAADLGYRTLFVLDATHTFDLETPDGDVIPAAEVARVTAAILAVGTAEIVAPRDLV